MRSKIIVDIETVIDDTILPNHSIEHDGWPDPIAWKIIAIGIISVENLELNSLIVPSIRYLCCGTGDEKQLLEKFWEIIETKNPQIITWNGRSFDMQVLLHRAFKFNIPVTAWFQTGDKWNSYRQRYSENWHLDLMDVMAAFGASARSKQDLISKAIGLAGKVDVSGKDVDELYKDGKIKEIANYCETDVLNLYAIYLRWTFISGAITKISYKDSCDHFKLFLEKESEKKPHLREFLNKSSSFFEDIMLVQ